MCESLLPVLEGADVTPLLRHGRPAVQIQIVAREEDADLIVMTRHARWLGEGGRMFHRFLLNAVLARTIEEASCPVWIEPEGQGPPLRRLVCGITSLFRDRDLVALAGRLAKQTGARLVLFRNALKAEIAAPGKPRLPDSWQQELVAAVSGDLARMRGELDLPAEISVSIGAFLPGLLATAEADSLVVLRRTSAEWKEEEFVHDTVRGAPGPLLVCPDLRRPRPVHMVRRAAPSSPLGRVLRPAALTMWVLLGILAVFVTFRMALTPGCGSEYQCRFKAGLVDTAKSRPGAKRPTARFIIPDQPKDAPRPQ